MKKPYLVILFALLCISTIFLTQTDYSKNKDRLVSQVMLINGKKPIVGTWKEAVLPLEVGTLRRSDFEKITNKDYKVYWAADNIQRELVHEGSAVFSAQFSPSLDRLSFFYYPEGHSLGDVVLMIYNPVSNSFKEVYRNSYRTSNYLWKDDSILAVNYNCGTSCMLEYLVDSESGKIVGKQLLN